MLELLLMFESETGLNPLASEANSSRFGDWFWEWCLREPTTAGIPMWQTA